MDRPRHHRVHKCAGPKEAGPDGRFHYLAGFGVSMVTLYYMRRYMHFLRDLLGNEPGSFSVSAEVGQWLEGTASALSQTRSAAGNGHVDDDVRFGSLVELGQVAEAVERRIVKQGKPPAGSPAIIDGASQGKQSGVGIAE